MYRLSKILYKTCVAKLGVFCCTILLSHGMAIMNMTADSVFILLT